MTDYSNEHVIGDVLQGECFARIQTSMATIAIGLEYHDAGKLKRSDVFLTTKLPHYGHVCYQKNILENKKNFANF